MSVNYESIATDCDIIAQKIDSLRKVLRADKSERAAKLDEALFRAWNAMETAKEEAQ